MEIGVGALAWVMGVEPAPAPAPDAGAPLAAKVPWSQANCAGMKGGMSTGLLVSSVIVPQYYTDG